MRWTRSSSRNSVSPAVRIGELPSGPLGTISDVSGVTVGHCTLADGPVQTGVTMVLPHPGDAGDLFMHKVPAGAAVINGFGKSTGLMQVQELGVLESPIALTNTFAVGTVATALIRAAVAAQPGIGRQLPTLNPLVFECNDGYLNDLQAFAVTEAHALQALADAKAEFAQGAVGAGRGMSCFGLKGGIGSASRLARTPVGAFTVGALVLANFGRPAALTLAGRRIGPALVQRLAERNDAAERGSIILLVATDAPLDARQLRRVAVRAGAGLARTGSDYGHGSGDIALAFSTATTVPQNSAGRLQHAALLHESLLDPLFAATAEATEQAIVNALFAAVSVTGRDGHRRLALNELAPDWLALMQAAA
ncbi:aminopeptidase [Rhodoferax koreense]|uniref:Aminopeptidase n=1 Tax=Rhodoferax koreensis TaxID=1842727 RepID=A0A1P8JYB6_9BURK|nr:P1 family peptidase [Rhodoferax koreense]APW38752.1 aminopeptidase [Rhodoferax koreense]